MHCEHRWSHLLAWKWRRLRVRLLPATPLGEVRWRIFFSTFAFYMTPGLRQALGLMIGMPLVALATSAWLAMPSSSRRSRDAPRVRRLLVRRRKAWWGNQMMSFAEKSRPAGLLSVGLACWCRWRPTLEIRSGRHRPWQGSSSPRAGGRSDFSCRCLMLDSAFEAWDLVTSEREMGVLR